MGTTASSTAMSASDDRNNYLSSSEPSAAYQQTPNDITKEYIPSYCKVFGRHEQFWCRVFMIRGFREGQGHFPFQRRLGETSPGSSGWLPFFARRRRQTSRLFAVRTFAVFLLFYAPFVAGVVLPSGDINWGCPCLGNLSYGPCAVPFRDAFSCFHYSLADPKGSDCIEYFRDMTECMQRYPNLYPQDDGDDEEGEDAFSAIDKAEKQAAEEKRKSI